MLYLIDVYGLVVLVVSVLAATVWLLCYASLVGGQLLLRLRVVERLTRYWMQHVMTTGAHNARLSEQDTLPR